MKKQFLLFVSIFLLSVQIISAQTTTNEVRKISVGVLNGKALTLAKPAYPAAARAVEAEGAVNVNVTINETGDVVSAAAVSGHPLLRAAAVNAARESKFSPTQLSGQPVTVTGIIVYNFVADKAPSWLKVGHDLATAQHAPSLMFLNTNSIGKVLQIEWTTEKEQLQKLSEIKQADAPSPLSGRKISETTEKRPDGTTVKRMIVEHAVDPNKQPNSEQIAISQSLIASLQSRLGSDELNLWQFNTGISLSNALSKIRFSNDRERVLDALRGQIQSAPDKVSPEFLTELQKVLTILEKPKTTNEDMAQINLLMTKIIRNQ
jgi:TonB family protein